MKDWKFCIFRTRREWSNYIAQKLRKLIYCCNIITIEAELWKLKNENKKLQTKCDNLANKKMFFFLLQTETAVYILKTCIIYTQVYRHGLIFQSHFDFQFWVRFLTYYIKFNTFCWFPHSLFRFIVKI